MSFDTYYHKSHRTPVKQLKGYTWLIYEVSTNQMISVGYSTREDAREEARALRNLGYDVRVGKTSKIVVLGD